MRAYRAGRRRRSGRAGSRRKCPWCCRSWRCPRGRIHRDGTTRCSPTGLTSSSRLCASSKPPPPRQPPGPIPSVTVTCFASSSTSPNQAWVKGI